jgi:hypothetical protein
MIFLTGSGNRNSRRQTGSLDMRVIMTLLILALLLSVVLLARNPVGPAIGPVAGPSEFAPDNRRGVTEIAAQEHASQGLVPKFAAAQVRISGADLPVEPDHDHSGTDRSTDAIQADVLRAEFWQLADRNREAMYAVLWQALDDEDVDAELRDFIMETLDGRFDGTPGEMFSVLVRTAPTPALRIEVLRLLAEASQELSVGALRQALEDPDPAVRQSAAASRNELGVDALMDAMTEAVLASDHSVRVTAFQTLEDMHGFAAIWDVAERVIGDPDPLIRKHALELIFYGGAETAADHLEQALDDPDPQVSELAVALLAELEEGST